jgi:hypothetical protein
MIILIIVLFLVLFLIYRDINPTISTESYEFRQYKFDPNIKHSLSIRTNNDSGYLSLYCMDETPKDNLASCGYHSSPINTVIDFIPTEYNHIAYRIELERDYPELIGIETTIFMESYESVKLNYNLDDKSIYTWNEFQKFKYSYKYKPISPVKKVFTQDQVNYLDNNYRRK